MTKRYFQGERQENDICRVFQNYLENKRGYKSYLSKRESAQAPIDFLGRLYDKDNRTIVELAVEVRTLNISYIDNNFILFPIQKMNELMKFWRMGKEVYIVYKLKDRVYFISWDYYLKHNFEISSSTKGNSIKLPMQNFINCD